ncbi:IS481 family transposase [Streptomyces himalayensis]|uniref:IS481 family transposase n=1 Tax=Streptomyces himalayensis subsp. himalayensis TaxID=2756131 RepID=A0A7W0DR15_9ACTN|nr:IS481 family transposase [Streptomyces himalayensis]MBA2949676.1 IS481 family transposase [Streptomyces himalayensis subsp. himalayensis]
MTHSNAPLSVEGRRRRVQRCKTRPIAHVAAEMGISRACASKWVNRWRKHGELGLVDRSSTPHRQPTATPADVVKMVERMRREHKWSAARIAFELNDIEVTISRRTVTRLLAQLGLNRRRFIDPNGDTNRTPQTIIAKRPGHMVHVDVKKVGRIPDGGGWRAHDRDSDQARAAARTKAKSDKRGYVYLHSAIDGHTRLAYTEPLPDEKASTAIAFLHRARVWFAAHGITRVERIVTDNGSCYRADAFTRSLLGAKHKRTKAYTPQHNGKVQRYNRILAEEFLYSCTWTSEQQRSDALAVWNVHYNYHRPHGATGGKPPAAALDQVVANVMASYN